MAYIPELTTHTYGTTFLILLFAARMTATLVCFSSGAPGGVFAPMLVLGTLFGVCFGTICLKLFPLITPHPGMFAVAGMGGLFAATIRAPLTGILLIIELTQNYALILPLLSTAFGASLMAQILGGQPLYTLLLRRIEAREPNKEPNNEP